jgi:hypothetical protein
MTGRGLDGPILIQFLQPYTAPLATLKPCVEKAASERKLAPRRLLCRAPPKPNAAASACSWLHGYGAAVAVHAF